MKPLVLLATAFAIASANPVKAAPVNYFFEATIVDDIEGSVLDSRGQLGARGIGIGTTVIGSFTWDTTAALSSVFPDGASFFGPTSISASFAGVGVMVSSSSAQPSAFVVDSASGSSFRISAQHNGASPELSGLSYSSRGFVSLNFFDTFGTAFADTSLPTSLSLDDFDTPFFKFNGSQEAVGADEFVARITYLDTAPQVVPLPAGAWFLLTGLGWMAALKRRRQSSAINS